MMTAAFIIIAVIQSSCGRMKTDQAQDSGEASRQEQFHADADIAMSVSSIVDALKVGEALDSADYDFEGILTDGLGRPIYTDSQGNPGEWSVDVLTDSSAAIRNLNTGDLLPDQLEDYIVKGLGLDRSNIIESSEYDDDDDTEMSVYDFGAGMIRFEKRRVHVPNGTESVLMTIALGRYPASE